METHGKEGTRERYFADDDRYDLKEMVRREKMSTADDQEAMMARLASKVTIETGTQLCENYTLAFFFVTFTPQLFVGWLENAIQWISV